MPDIVVTYGGSKDRPFLRSERQLGFPFLSSHILDGMDASFRGTCPNVIWPCHSAWEPVAPKKHSERCCCMQIAVGLLNCRSMQVFVKEYSWNGKCRGVRLARPASRGLCLSGKANSSRVRRENSLTTLDCTAQQPSSGKDMQAATSNPGAHLTTSGGGRNEVPFRSQVLIVHAVPQV